ncbi:RAD52 motif-containing protein 1-like isoform X2 [Erinaceus europaeus]|uniref:RAD52 motif-containing protein 1 n=1 Tax=Erinaceus europaeus TaxID=9365 RepID=A0ABM3YDY0_ERIEU|nr:RAD52 motif-containing protein 1-like isoform X2 [Erinaceus europaeus]
MAQVIPFAIPMENDKTLLVWELSCGPTAEALHHSLFIVFSQFGLLYSVRVFPNAAVAGPGFYAIIKFYSARDAQKAQKACNQKQLFQNSPVKGIKKRKASQPSCPTTDEWLSKPILDGA